MDNTITTHVTETIALTLIERAGIERRDASTRRGPAFKYMVPEEARPLIGDHEWTWELDEALMWAMVIIAAVDDPDLLAWR
jgi:hypothetical protein